MPPGPRVSVRRERTDELFDAAAAVPLTVVCAPAGGGKTTAVGDWLASRGRRSTWLTIEAADNDVENLFSRLLSLWGDVAAAFGEGLSVVLDDFQLLTRRASHRAVEAMVDKLPTGVQAIVISRTPPPLRLGRRRAAGTIFEVGSDDLAFTADEAEALLNGTFGLGLDAARLDEVTAAVGGWPAGLSLVARSLRDAPGGEFGSGLELARRRIAEYLREEVPLNLDPDLRDFLRREPAAREAESAPELHLRASRWSEGTGTLAEAAGDAGPGGDALRGSLPTRAERRVLARLDRGLTFNEAAADLYVSIHTVKSHAQRLYRRLGVNSRQAAVEVARERGLLD
jgi:ATP/maltotriose-dependent transcriptional regulator MalT